MTRLRACYPQRVADGDHWVAMCARYYEELGHLDEAVLSSVFADAWRHCPAFFPSLGELGELYQQRAKRIAAESASLALPDVGQWSGDGAAKAREIAAKLSMPKPEKTEAQKAAARRRGYGE